MDYNFVGWMLCDVEMGYNYDLNGCLDLIFCSWNCFYICLMVENGNWLVEVKLWYVVGNMDDNLDIIKYMGYYQFKIGYYFGDVVLSVKGQYNWNIGYGGVELGLSYLIIKYVCFYIQVYSGYGELFIDYNFNQICVGVGVMLNDLF